MSGGRPTAAFYLAVLAVVGGLVYFAGSKAGLFGEADKTTQPATTNGEPTLDPDALNLGADTAEAPTGGDIVTTVQEYSYVPAERLPAVKGTAAYKPLEDNTVRFALNVWAGWAPIIHANEGFQPKKIWKTPDGTEFKVHLILADNPVEMRDAYASGDFHIGWATVDMLPLFMEGFVDKSGEPRDSRVMPRIFQQIDWSNGGDGIVVLQRHRRAGEASAGGSRAGVVEIAK